MILRICVVSFLAVSAVLAANRGDTCTTPNGESAICTAVLSCTVIKEALATYNRSAINFARQSQCGYDTDPLVCCGTVGFLSPIAQNPIRRPGSGAISNNLLPDRTTCGIERENNRVLGGTSTGLDEFPWMALLRYKWSDGTDAGFKCGGTVINNRYVLTAAHCIQINPHNNFALDSVRLGEWVISEVNDCIHDLANEECADPVQDIVIEKQIPHPFYSTRSGNNDVGLLRLTRNIVFSDYIRPICLPPAEFPSPPPGTLMTTAGWGATENSSAADVKMKVLLPLVTNAECAEKLSISLRARVTPNQVCAGGVAGKDACQGDSGGPLMRPYNDDSSDVNQWYQEGIVAWGVGCGRRGLPGIYTRVPRYILWIQSNMEE